MADNDTAATPAAFWLEKLEDAERSEKTYHAKCDKIDDLYADLERLASSSKDREMQVFWANLEVLKPTVYSRAPVQIVSSRFNDRRDLPRRAGEILERALVADGEADDVHGTLLLGRDDLCIAARGVVWMKMKERDGLELPCAYHVDRTDFRHEVARKWQEVSWVARRSWNTKDEVKARFKTVPEGMVFEKQKIGGRDGGEKKAQIWELWSKSEKVVIWVSQGVEDLLDKRKPADVLGDLTDFFPCPRPAYGTVKRGTLIPVPDFVYYKDQLEEINDLTNRIAALTKALRVRGFYPAGNADVADAIDAVLKSEDDRAIVVPVSSLAALGTMSLKDAIVWLPVADIATVVRECVELRRQLIQDVYEITGLSDIMRGATDAQETLGAQKLKSQYGSVRVKERQAEMVRLARDITRMKAEIMAEQVPIDQLMTMAQVDDLPSQADIEQQKQQAQQQAMKAVEGIVMQAMQAQQQPQMPPQGAPPPQQAPM